MKNDEIVQKYEYDGKIFDTYLEASMYRNNTNIKAWTLTGNPCSFDEDVAGFILTTNVEQNEYIREKGIDLTGNYGLYYFNEKFDVWSRVPNEVVEEITRRFK